MEKVCGVYRIRNIKTGMFYIGGSRYDVRNRFNGHRSYLNLNRHENPPLQASWNKNGIDCFTFDLIVECRIDDVLRFEQALINLFWESGVLYNVNKEAIMPPITKRVVCCYDANGVFVKRFDSLQEAADFTKTYYQTISAVCSGRKLTAGGYYWAYEGNLPVVRESKEQRPRAVWCFDDDGNKIKWFDSISNAGRFFNAGPTAICGACNGRVRKAYGYFWAYDGERPIIKDKKVSSRIRPVLCFDKKSGDFVGCFDSAEDAGRKLNILTNKISFACTGKQKSSYGYTWKYA